MPPRGLIQIGAGPTVQFAVPTDVTGSAPWLTLTLSGDGGAVSQDHDLVTLQAPAVSIATPSAGLTFWVGEVIACDGSAADAQDGALSGTSLVWEYEVGSLGRAQIATGASSSLAAPAHPDGTYPYTLTIYLTATDSDGNSAEASVQVAVDEADTTAPVIAFTGLRIRGTVDDPTVAAVLVDGSSYGLTGGQFDVSIAVSGAPQTMNVAATDPTVTTTRSLTLSRP